MTTHVTIDIRKFEDSGIGTYVQNLVPRVVALRHETRFTLIAKPDFAPSGTLATAANMTLVPCAAAPLGATEQVALMRVIPKDTDIFWAPHFNIPLAYQGKILVTIHDLFHLAMPHMASAPQRTYVRTMANAIKKKATRVIAVSDFTATEMVKFTGINEARITTIHEGVDESWFVIPDAPTPHPRPYILFVGLTRPHKNLRALMEAVDELGERVKHDVVIVGPQEGVKTTDAAVRHYAGRLGDRVRFTGRVAFADLQQYYKHADLFVFPSLYEGFGLPPLEAMAAGCPVVASNAASLPEICGDAAHLVDARNSSDLARGILRGLTDDTLRDELRHKGAKRAHHFQWSRTAEKTAQVINLLLHSHR